MEAALQNKNSVKILRTYVQQFRQFSFKVLLRISAKVPSGIKFSIFPDRVLHALKTRGPGAGRPQRVYLKKGISPIDFFDQLNNRNIDYVLLRWWEKLPSFPLDEDVNILVRDEQRVEINDLFSAYDERGIKCDVYTLSGSGSGSREGVPVFPYNLSDALLRNRVFYNGAYIPSPLLAFAAMAYHAILHKGYNSGIPGFQKQPDKFIFNYAEALEKMAQETNLQVEITLTGLFKWLKEKDFAPADDTLAKLAKNRPELSVLEKRLSSDARGGEFMVFVIREKLLHDGFLNDFVTRLEERHLFDVLDVRLLNMEEKHAFKTQVRGGKWDKGPFPVSGGAPAAVVTAYDYHPEPLKEMEQKDQTRMTNRNNLRAKYGFRDYLGFILKNGFYNGVHSADNENDAWFYISHLGESYTNKISIEVEKRRIRYAPKWNVQKTLSAGPLSKVELIKYNGGQAVKKTFRPGRERFFERELFAVKHLAPQLSFIPPLLYEGDGYIVTQYFENVLEKLNEKEKKQLIALKAKDIIQVTKEMQKRGLAYVNFNPDNLIITNEGRLICTGFSYLQENRDGGFDHVYEIVGLSHKFGGDHPENLGKRSRSLSYLWSDYLPVTRFLDLENQV